MADPEIVVYPQNFGAVGDGTTDDTTAFEDAIDYAVTVVTSASYLGKITLFVSHGKYKITSQLTIPKNVDLYCQGVLYNNLTDKWQPLVVFEAGSHCSSLKLWGNSGSGVTFGSNATYADSNIGDIRLWDIGTDYDAQKGGKIGIAFYGYDFNFNSIEIDGGNVAIDLDGASDIRGNYIIAWGASTGLKITSGCEHVYLGYVDIDTPSYLGMQIDSSHDIEVNGQIFLNDTQSPSAITNACLIGNYSSNDYVNNLKLSLRVQDTGGTALNISNIENSTINLIATNADLATGNDHDITTGIAFGSNVAASTHIYANIDSSIATQTTGSGGTLVLSKVDAAYSHISNTSNPHSVTKTQVGLSNVTNDEQLPLSGGTLTGAVTDNNGSNIFHRLNQQLVINTIKNNVTSSSNIRRLCFFDETGATTTIKDRSSNLTNMTLSANASTLSPTVVGSCRNLNFTSSAYWEFADSNDLSFGNGTADSAFSIVTLMNLNSLSAASTILAKRDKTTGNTQLEYDFQIDTNKLVFWCIDNSTNGYIGRYYNVAISGDIGSWHVYAGTYSGSSSAAGFKIYRDGSQIDNNNYVGGSYTAMENLTAKVGNYSTSAGGTREYISNAKQGFIMIIAEELTATQVKNITNTLLTYVGNDAAYV